MNTLHKLNVQCVIIDTRNVT